MFDIKPSPKTALESWERWQNNTQAKFVALKGKKVEVDQVYICMHCHKQNTDWQWVCDGCSDRAEAEG